MKRGSLAMNTFPRKPDMPLTGRTTLLVSVEIRNVLYARKGPSRTYDQFLRELLNVKEAQQ